MRLELTRRTDYAVRAMIALARQPDETLSSTELSESTHIPVRFVTQVMSNLVRADLVSAVIGRSGGYRLGSDPESVSVLSIVEAVEGDVRRQHCTLRGGPCQVFEPCEIHHVFSGAQEAFIAQLASSTLAAVAAAQPAPPAGALVEPHAPPSRTSSDASPGTPQPEPDAGD